MDDIQQHDKVAKPSSASSLHLSGNSAEFQPVEYVDYDESENMGALEIVQDVEPVLEHIKAVHNEGGKDAGKSKSGDLYWAGSFPEVLVQSWLTIKGLKWHDFKGEVVKNFLNDPAHAAFRVWKGRV